MRIALGLASLAVVATSAAAAWAQPAMPREPSWLAPSAEPAGSPPPASLRSKGLSLEQIRAVMRAHAGDFNACLAAATKPNKPLHGPFLYRIEVDKKGKVIAARPYQPSAIVAFDRCVVRAIKRAIFPGGPASIEAPLVFDSQ